MKALGMGLIVLLVGSGAFAATWYVPDHSPTIQGAILSSANGDTIIVRAGTYSENIDFMGRAITLKSESGAVTTIIDGMQASSVVSFFSGEGSTTLLKGFTLSNGKGSPDPYGGMSGAGIHCINSHPIITDNIVIFNTVSNLGDYGAGICLWGSNPVITNNHVKYNNNISDDGGGISCWDGSDAMISHNLILGNTAGGGGGGIDCIRSSPTIYNNRFDNNIAGVAGNGSGGGIRCVGDLSGAADPYILNNTIRANFAQGAQAAGGGISTLNNSNPTLINTIIWGNTATSGPQIDGSGAGPFIVDYCCVEGGLPQVWGVVAWGPGNITANPQFTIGPVGVHYLSQIASGQPVDSPCLDAGSPFTPMVNGHTRTDQVQDSGSVDIGLHFRGGMSLMVDGGWLSVGGGMVNFSLDAGVGQANRNYLILGSMSGSMPGIPLPGGLATLPVNWDNFTNTVLNKLNTPVFANFYGTLDALGQSQAQITVGALNPSKLGKIMTYAYCLEGTPWDFASNPITVEFVP